MLGDLLLEVSQSAPALKEYEAVLQNSPNRFNSLYGAALAAELLGDHKKARAYYEKLAALCSHSDASRPELQKAKIYLKK
jgi:tetratricopeptide (TPR) repeat protein